ncbi:uncharacterized protein STEHIDRAFT_136098 [Stereum hirsutum FP-91666 SS1]|uniref:uncharacterized protein n=1 Tax=Stereum hirsutum (strain FP-91666) TaxID=721885 RepID=UPI000440B959|nr:uncharacterized protein STEHIDRAFT_136098 [Stereum hirsutum FP-91666 SS1]EIM92067.1 hypothetical protein STEHIDRAFT_136098 [Stereum hirsutum FP-91666 SS1]
MGHCPGCLMDFPHFKPSSPDDNCPKCMKLVSISSAVDRKKLQDQPQCMGCGVSAPFLTPPLCGPCLKSGREDGSALLDIPGTAELLAQNKTAHEKDASQHRINTKAAQATSKATTIKKQVNAQKQAALAGYVNATVQLWEYPSGTGSPRKVQLPPFSRHFERMTSADSVFDILCKQASEEYVDSPARQTDTAIPSFERTQVRFAIQTQAQNQTLIQDSELNGTIGELINTLKTTNRLSKTDESSGNITLRLYLYALRSGDDEDEDEEEIAVSNRKRKLPRASHAPARPSKAPYRSGYLPSASLRNLNMDKYPFDKGVAEYVDGLVEIKASGKLIATIPRDWQKYKKGGKRQGGYIGQGLSKYAFQGRIDGKDYAILQMKPIDNHFGEDDDNETALQNELKLMVLGQYLIQTFYDRAKYYDMDLAKLVPKMTWNADEAFLGKVADSNIQKGSKDASDPDERSLLWPMFLATPLIPDSYQEVKFSGNEQWEGNSTVVGRVIDAYAHHTVLDTAKEYLFVDLQGFINSKGSVILFDPQAHTSTGDSGYWDKGPKMIEEYLKNHICNSYCRQLKLDRGIPGREVDVGESESFEEPEEPRSFCLTKREEGHPMKIVLLITGPDIREIIYDRTLNMLPKTRSARHIESVHTKGHKFVQGELESEQVELAFEQDELTSYQGEPAFGQGHARINQMEREMCSYLEWQLNVEPKILKEFEDKCKFIDVDTFVWSSHVATQAGTCHHHR